MTTIVHLTDLHCPPDDPRQAEALVTAVSAIAPVLVAVTGDLTRAERRSEYRMARAVLARLGAPVLAVPGNHDVPVWAPWERVFAPFARFEAYVGRGRTTFAADGLFAAGLNTAGAVQARLGWSLGIAPRSRVAETASAVASALPDVVRAVLAHHPLLPEDSDPYRSQTIGGASALAALTEAGADLYLFGHLHAPLARPAAPGGPLLVASPAGFGNRDRGHGAGFSVIAAADGTATVTPHLWDGTAYAPGTPATFPLPRLQG